MRNFKKKILPHFFSEQFKYTEVTHSFTLLAAKAFGIQLDMKCDHVCS